MGIFRSKISKQIIPAEQGYDVLVYTCIGNSYNSAPVIGWQVENDTSLEITSIYPITAANSINYVVMLRNNCRVALKFPNGQVRIFQRDDQCFDSIQDWHKYMDKAYE